MVATDALIGTFASMHDPSLVQNRCFLYHLIGNGTGEWRVPVGGMGAVTDALRRAATEAGAEVITSAGVSGIRDTGDGAEVTWHDGGRSHTVAATHVLANVAPWVLRILLGESEQPDAKPQGAQLKINLLLDRLPRLRSGVDPAVAFAGTLHLAEDYTQLERAYAEAAAGGRCPTTLPGEVYCHSLTDPSILGDARGRHPHADLLRPAHPRVALRGRPGGARELAVSSARSPPSTQHLAEPIEDCLARDADGNPCLEAKIPQDVERDLAMPGGHIFHGDLDWPWAANRARLDTPAQQWGVQTETRPRCCSAAPAPGAAARSPGSAATTPPRRCWRRGETPSGARFRLPHRGAARVSLASPGAISSIGRAADS